ncbi:MAG TPA: ASPIC/UnbV domain-containing protein, partial [bacterium]|nr:ASPIC/UnbV domain-containing protein [bacterium]
GDLDVLVTNSGATTNDYFVNNGDGTFTQDLASALVALSGAHYGAANCDYDRDGDLDMYVHGTTATKQLFRNDLANGNHWVEMKLVGAGAPGGSNVSALGARVRAQATIGGTPTWQMREVSAQNSFNSMNMLDVHFGFGDATVIDSLEITWPAGGVQVFTGLAVDRQYEITEGVDPTGVELGAAPNTGVRLLPSRPNPFSGATVVAFDLPRTEDVQVRVFDLAGREIRTLFRGRAEAGRHTLDWDGRDAQGSATAAGVYFVKLQGSGGADLSQKVVRLR